jgi:hypothetical protein
MDDPGEQNGAGELIFFAGLVLLAEHLEREFAEQVADILVHGKMFQIHDEQVRHQR